MVYVNGEQYGSADQYYNDTTQIATSVPEMSDEQAAAMEIPLRRVGLLAEEDLRYAIAYSLFKTGAFDEAESHLSQLNRPDLFRKAAELRRAIQDCAEDSWKCL